VGWNTLSEVIECRGVLLGECDAQVMEGCEGMLGEQGFADPRWPSEGDEGVIVERFFKSADVALTADQRGMMCKVNHGPKVCVEGGRH